jgi:hypothetical protein
VRIPHELCYAGTRHIARRTVATVIYTLRTFLVARAAIARFVELSEHGVWPALEQRDGRALGLWTVVMGGPERIVLMTRYDSLAHWQATRSWPAAAHRAVPADEQRRGREAGVARAALTRETDLIALQPLSRRMPLADAPETEPGIYTLRTFRVRPRDDGEFAHLTEEAIWPWFETMGSRHLGLWRAIIAEDPQLYMLSRYDDLAHWQATRGAGPEPDDASQRQRWRAARDALARRAALTQHSGVRVLRPISARRP